MDEAPNGVIFFSLGSNVMHTMVTKKFFEIMVAGLAEVPYQVLFKTDSELKYVPKNFKVSAWMPQQDILRKLPLLFVFGIFPFYRSIYTFSIISLFLFTLLSPLFKFLIEITCEIFHLLTKVLSQGNY